MSEPDNRRVTLVKPAITLFIGCKTVPTEITSESKMQENLTLSNKQKRGIGALLVSGDVSEAAAAAGVTRDSLYRWMKQPHFGQALREAEAQQIALITRSLGSAGVDAVEALQSIVRDESQPASARVKAADAILARLLTFRSQVELESRVIEIERQLEIGASR